MSGDVVVRECFNLDGNADESEIKHVMASAYCNPKGEQNHIQQLDYKMKETLNRFNERINRYGVVVFVFFFIFNFPKEFFVFQILFYVLLWQFFRALN